MKKILYAFIYLSVLHANNSSFSSLEYVDGNEYKRIVIKLKEVTYGNGILPLASTLDVNNTNTIESIATSLNQQVSVAFNLPLPLPDANSTELNSTKELRKYIAIDLDESVIKEEIVNAVNDLNQLDNVDIAYANPSGTTEDINTTEILSLPNASTPNLINNQGYLNPAPNGIDAKFAWTLQGGNGDSVKIIDTENAWNRNHEDLPDFFAKVGSIDTSSSKGGQDHGTAVVGVMVAKDNEFGSRGIVCNASIGTSGSWLYGSDGAIIAAAQELGEGDVILIENQYKGPDNGKYTPMENIPAVFNAIQYATEKGITVVEAAGNGASNLDSSAYNNAFNRNYRDSGAILVAASHSTQRTPVYFTNYGSRIDVHAWGDWTVTTLAYGDAFNGGNKNRIYTNTFAGTSSATPIVAGAVASLQGVAKARLGRFLTPKEVRDILSSTATPQTGGFSKHIGGLPNLRSAIAHLPPKVVITKPNKPSNIILSEITDISVALKWSDNTTTEQGYRIYKDSTLIATLPVNATSYKITDLLPDTSYTYTIKAFNSSGESAGLVVTFKTDKNLTWMIPVIYYPMLLAQ